MFKDRRSHLVKILQAVFNFVTYGNKDTGPLEDEIFEDEGNVTEEEDRN